MTWGYYWELIGINCAQIIGVNYYLQTFFMYSSFSGRSVLCANFLFLTRRFILCCYDDTCQLLLVLNHCYTIIIYLTTLLLVSLLLIQLLLLFPIIPEILI